MAEGLREKILEEMRKANENSNLYCRVDDPQLEVLAQAAMDAIRPIADVGKMEPVICYFQTNEDREEFIAAIQAVNRNMRTVKV